MKHNNYLQMTDVFRYVCKSRCLNSPKANSTKNLRYQAQEKNGCVFMEELKIGQFNDPCLKKVK